LAFYAGELCIRKGAYSDHQRNDCGETENNARPNAAYVHVYLSRAQSRFGRIRCSVYHSLSADSPFGIYLLVEDGLGAGGVGL
jgi:hypothetical protein